LFTHKLNIVHSQTEHCSLTKRTLFTNKLNIVHLQTKHCSFTSWRLFTDKQNIVHKCCSLISWTLFTDKLTIVHSQTEKFLVYEWTVSTTSLNNIDQFTIYSFIIVNNNCTLHKQFVNNQWITYFIQVNIILDTIEQC